MLTINIIASVYNLYNIVSFTNHTQKYRKVP